jgi:hypothetical protein
MNSKYFEFDGNWEYKIELPQLAGFQERKGSYTSISFDLPNQGSFNLEFEDDISDNPEPTVDQFNTLDYIFNNQELILNAIIERTLVELPNILINYDLVDEEEYQNLNKEKVKKLIGLSTIYIKLIAKENYSYFDIIGGCNWDEEHGLNILFHKSRIISFSDENGGSIYEAEKDNGTDVKNRNFQFPKTFPKKYIPHPKYNKLKPSQIKANDSFEYSLILNHFNKEFIAAIENKEIQINGICKILGRTYLETACWFNNNDIVEFLLNKNAEIGDALHQSIVYNNNEVAMKLLLKKGANINVKSGNGNTVLFETIKSMESYLRAETHYTEINRIDLLTDENIEILKILKNRILYLIKNGADLEIKNLYGYNCFDLTQNSDELTKKAMTDFLKFCTSQK